MTPVITLTTDFGLSDGYVAAMKGTILAINPQVTIVDISHQVKPQDIAGAAFLLGTAYHYFPAGTIHVIVVDPGVGTERRAIALSTPVASFVAPDNGVLSYVMEQEGARPGNTAHQRTLSPGMKAVALTNASYWRHPLSATFHGRDIFAPVAAHLSRGVLMEEMGEPISSLTVFPVPRPQRLADGSLSGEVIYIDYFGNLITDIKDADLPKGDLLVEVAGHQIRGLSASYAQGAELLAIIGSSGRLEVSGKNGSAAQLLQAKVGDGVMVSARKPVP